MTTKPERSKCSTRRFATISAMISSALWTRLRPWYRSAIILGAILLALPVLADSPDSAQRLLSGWKAQDPNMRMVAEMIAAAFGNGLSWRGTLAGKDVYCPPPGLTGTQIMATFERFVRDNPDIAERPYGDAMAATLSREFPCQAR